MRRPLVLLALATAAVALLGVASAPPATAASARPAAVRWRSCDLGTTRPARCGSIRVPLDRTDPRSPDITIGFGLLAADRPTGRTIVAQEGGPGYPSTGTAPDYEALFGSALATHDLLVVDERGTGRSTPIDCEPLQPLSPRSSRFAAAVTACGRQLDHTWRRREGGWVHAADLFTTANGARDLAAVLGALHTGPVDLYGDSYGTYFAQSFLARFPSLVASVVLDSAYEARDLDPWYTTTATTARRALADVCTRAIGCPSGSPWARLSRLVQQVRRHPLRGTAPGTDGHRHRTEVDVTALVDMVNDAGYDIDVDRQLDAAVRAELDRHDARPLLRLWLQDIGVDEAPEAAVDDSNGQYLAVACTDYPQLWDPRAAPATRQRQLDASIAALPARTFAPFTTREWIRVEAYTEAYTACLNWPAPTHPADPPVPAGRPLDAAGVPVLILNGDLDSLTPAAGGAHIARQIGPVARRLVAANTVHLVALDATDPCAPAVVRRFVADPRGPLHAACLGSIPAVRAVPVFPARVADMRAASGPGPRTLRRLVALAVQQAGDALTRSALIDGTRDDGLRGGVVRTTADGVALDSVRLASDASASGSVTATDDGATGDLVIRSDGHAVRVRFRWGAGRVADATASGLRFTTPAP